MDDIEATLVPRMRTIAEQVSSTYPDVSMTPGGPSRQTDWYIVAVSCVLPGKDRDEADLLDLEVVFSGLSFEPMISCADVVWGHPSGHLEGELHKHPRRVDESSWTELLDSLTRLHAALEAGLRRGRPPE